MATETREEMQNVEEAGLRIPSLTVQGTEKLVGFGFVKT
jgi:hypothetical protein